MSLLEDLFRKPVILPGTASQRLRRQTSKPPVETPNKKPYERGCDYALAFIKKEEQLHAESKQDAPSASNDDHGSLSDIESMSYEECPSMSDTKDVFKRYPIKRKQHIETLPIFEQKDEILEHIRSRKVVIIKGATGCGKTTQVPQFILNWARDINHNCNIVVTQPRRIAAISVAERVATEMGCPLGTLVGYQVGLERKINDDTRLLFCTTGVLLQKLINQKNLHEFTHIILDEVHERDQDMDFLLLIVRKLLFTNSKDCKVILMSATIDTPIFSEYFYTLVNKVKEKAIVVDIREQCKHDIHIASLDDIKNRIPQAHGIELDINNPKIERKSYLTAVSLIQCFDDIDDGENKTKGRKSGTRGSVLVFLPGLHEIEEMESCLRAKEKDAIHNRERTFQWVIMPLHSTITQEERNLVFKRLETGYRKIILSTNIAESSITVEDIDYVIDFCLTKIMVTDPVTNYCHLKLEWASKSSLKQRAGRVGRVSSGRVFRLITDDFYAELDEETTPEMLRSPLDRLVLQTKLLDMGEPRAIFALALSQPHLENIEHTILTLKEIGALLVTTNKEFTIFDGDLTRMGLIMAKLPLDVRLSKLIFIGSLFGVLEECIVIACALSVRNVFCQPFREYLRSYNMKLNWADSTCSDCIAFCNAYTSWRKKQTEGTFRQGRGDMKKWAKDHYVEIRALRDIGILEKEITTRLKHARILRHTDRSPSEEKPKRALFIKLAIAAAFYPHYFFRGSQGGQVDEKDAVITLGGHDPFKTVYLQGVPHNQHSILYKRAIQQKFSQCSNRVNVLTDSSAKVFVEFGRSKENSFDPRLSLEIPGKISLAVYRAVKMRQQPDFKFKIPVLNPADASLRYQRHLERSEKSNHDRPSRFPAVPWPWNQASKQDNVSISELIEVNISHIESPHHFWAQSRFPDMIRLLFSIERNLNEPDALVPLDSPPKVGRLYAALYTTEMVSNYYRCRILSVNDDEKCDIYFVDYGNTMRNYEYNGTSKILEFSSSLLQRERVDAIPDLAIECSLAKIRPRSSTTGEGAWSPKAISLMVNNYLQIDQAVIEIYSFVNNIASVKLKIPRHSQTECFNVLLVQRGLAEKCEESYLSVLDHEERKRMRRLVTDGAVPLRRQESPSERREESHSRGVFVSGSTNLEEDLEPKNYECSQEIVLRGPFSPLEMKIFGGTASSLGKFVRIESTSVNSVLLDTNPSDTHERMVVASCVTTNVSGDALTLRSTTIMPNLPGLPALVCLMFAPMAELRTNASSTKLSGALCGLGYDPNTGQSMFAENDIELLFDVELTMDDIVRINRIRFWLNRAACVTEKSADEEAEEIMTCRDKLMLYINQLFEKRYDLQELNFFQYAHKWCQKDVDDFLCPCSDSAMGFQMPGDDFVHVYRLIWGVRLDGDPSAETAAVDKNIRQLRNFARGQGSIKSMECILCRVTISNAINAKLHLKSAQHKIRQRRFDIPDEPIDGSRFDLSEYR